MRYSAFRLISILPQPELMSSFFSVETTSFPETLFFFGCSVTFFSRLACLPALCSVPFCHNEETNRQQICNTGGEKKIPFQSKKGTFLLTVVVHNFDNAF